MQGKNLQINRLWHKKTRRDFGVLPRGIGVGEYSEFAVISEEDYLFGFVFELVKKLGDSG